MKRGKYEKQFKWSFPVKAAPKAPVDAKKELKSVLLRTYFTSLISLVLCVSLFLGTSYAWFTSEVTQSGNEIHVGRLSATISKAVLKDGKTDWMKMSSDPNSPKLFDKNAVWNPGYTMVETVKIANEGNLDFKYVLSLTNGSLEIATGTSRTVDTVAQQFDVWVHDHKTTYKAPASFADVKEANGWKHVGTVREILAGTPLVTADLDEGTDSFHTYTIAVHMSEGAGSELMGAKLSMSVKLVAYQKVGDAGAVTPAANAQSLKTAAAKGENILMSGNINIASAAERIVMNGGVLDGANNKITYTGGRVDAEGNPVTSGGNSAGVITTTGGVISNLLVDGNGDGRALYVTNLASDLTVTGCTLSGAYSFNINSANKTDHVVRFTSCYLNNWTSYANVASRVDFVGCTFKDVLKPYGDTLLTGCTFEGSEDAKGLDITALEVGEAVTLVNCTYKGQSIEKAVITAVENANGKTISITGPSANLLTVNTTNSTYPLKLAN